MNNKNAPIKQSKQLPVTPVGTLIVAFLATLNRNYNELLSDAQSLSASRVNGFKTTQTKLSKLPNRKKEFLQTEYEKVVLELSEKHDPYFLQFFGDEGKERAVQEHKDLTTKETAIQRMYERMNLLGLSDNELISTHTANIWLLQLKHAWAAQIYLEYLAKLVDGEGVLSSKQSKRSSKTKQVEFKPLNKLGERRIIIQEDLIDHLVDALQIFFSKEDQKYLSQLLRGEKLDGQLVFLSNANRLVHLFSELQRKNKIIMKATGLKKWIEESFLYKASNDKPPRPISKDTLDKVFAGNTPTKSKIISISKD